MARPLLLLHLFWTALQIPSTASMSTGMASSDAACPSEVEIELFPFIRVYKNGTIERLLGTDTVPASFDTTTGVASKDVSIDPATGLSVRLYLPPAAATAGGKKLPVLVYFHGGGFMIESAASPTYHRYLNALAARAGALAVSVEYRRVPEHPLPAAYDDSWAALAWAVAGCAPGGPEPWLAAHGDASHVFLAGDSAGANIAHNVALRAAAAAEGLPQPGAAIGGVMLVHPYFWDPSNAMAPELEVRIRREWAFMCARPDAEMDDPRLCPTCAGAAPQLAALPCGRVTVAVAGDDFLAAKGRAYYAALLASGWSGEAELVDTPGQGHVFHLLRPGTEAAAEMMDRVAAFISRA